MPDSADLTDTDRLNAIEDDAPTTIYRFPTPDRRGWIWRIGEYEAESLRAAIDKMVERKLNA